MKTALLFMLLACGASAAEQSFERTPNPWKLVVPAESALPPGPTAAVSLTLTPEQALAVGRRLWQNEGGGSLARLAHWNPGENFASMGIGHFIWYPLGMEGPFVETFPALLAYLEGRGVIVPDWLRGGVPCPWDSREEFYAQARSAKMRRLRQLMKDTIPLQAEFAAARLTYSWPRMLAALPPRRRAAVSVQFQRLARSPAGAYPLIDYVDFKGEGLSPTERYRGRGWGLLQVLEGMRGSEGGQAAFDDFADSAEAVLRRRVKLSPRRRRERLWLGTWLKRVETYRAAQPGVPR